MTPTAALNITLSAALRVAGVQKMDIPRDTHFNFSQSSPCTYLTTQRLGFFILLFRLENHHVGHFITFYPVRTQPQGHVIVICFYRKATLGDSSHFIRWTASVNAILSCFVNQKRTVADTLLDFVHCTGTSKSI